MTINLRKMILLWGFILSLSAISCARPNRKICQNRNGKFPRPGTSCRGYYECNNYVPVERTCGDEENFNANKGRCDWEETYPCLEKQKDKECPRENGLFLKPGTNCKKYYRCCNGKAKVEACSGDLLFDPSKGNCEYPDLYTCIEKPERKECPRRNGQFLKPRTNCKKYFNCSNGEPEEQKCQRNMLFNPATEKCESAELYTCIEKPERKECPERNGKFLKPGTNCRKYYECSNGEPEERKCAVGTLFDPSTKNCEMEGKYTCTETPDKNKCIRRNGKFLKPGTNCKEYYKCSDGRPRSKKCDRNMLFNPASEKCESSKFYTCIESLSTTEKLSSTVTIFEITTPPLKSSTDPAISKSTVQETTERNRITYSTHDPDTSTKLNTQTTPNEGQTTFQTRETSTVSQPITSKISTSQPTTEISPTLERKEISTTIVFSTTQSTITEVSTSQPTITEISISQPTTSEISTSQPTTTEISTTQSTISEISSSQPTASEISTTLPTTTEISTSQPTTTEISTSQSTITGIPTSQPTTTESSTSQRTSATSTLRPTASEISIISQATSPHISSTILKENKEFELTKPTSFKTTTEETFSPSTVDVTTSAELCSEPNGQFPHPTDKRKFVVCSNNIPYIFSCPSDLVYKLHLKRCDYE